MTAPAFLATSFYFTELAGVTDVQTILDTLATLLKTTNSPPWTEPTAGTFQSPVDSYGRCFTMTPVKESATRLSWVIKDRAGIRMHVETKLQVDTAVGGSVVRIYSGQYHLVIESMNGATRELLMASIIDQAPETPGQPASYIAVWAGARNAAGTLMGNGFDSWHLNGAATGPRLLQPVVYSNASEFLAHDGSIIFAPVDICSGALSAILYGRLYQFLFSDDAVVPGSDYTVPLDDSATGIFRGLTNVANGANGFSLSIRKA